jgi:hypothetical protein
MTVVVNNRKNEKALLLQVLNTHTSLIILFVCCKANQTKYATLHVHNFVAILEIYIITDSFFDGSCLCMMCALCYVPIEKVQFILSVEGCVELIQKKIHLPHAVIL